jgi:hypothetical protein
MFIAFDVSIIFVKWEISFVPLKIKLFVHYYLSEFFNSNSLQDDDNSILNLPKSIIETIELIQDTTGELLYSKSCEFEI